MTINSQYSTATRYALTIDGGPYQGITSEIVDYSIPSVNVPVATQSAKLRDVPHPGSKILFEPLNVTILLTRGLDTYKTMFDWIMETVATQEEARYDVTAMAYDVTDNVVASIRYKDAFPTSIGNVQFTSSDISDTIPRFQATLEYSEFVFT